MMVDYAYPSPAEGVPLKPKHRARLKVALAVASATVFIFPFKHAASHERGAGAALGLLLFSGLIFGPWAAVRWPRVEPEKRAGTLALSWKMAAAAAFGNIAQGYAFEGLHAGVATTFIQLNVLFVALLGFLWLKERLSREMMIGVTLACLGVTITQYPSLSGHFEWSLGVFWAVGAALGFSCVDLLSRRYAQKSDAVVANALRSLLGAALLFFVPGAADQFLSMSTSQLMACAAAAFLGPGLARWLLMSASRHLPAAETALLQQLRPPLALPLTSLVFQVWPTPWEWAGSAFAAAGVGIPLLLSLVRYRRAHSSAQSNE